MKRRDLLKSAALLPLLPIRRLHAFADSPKRLNNPKPIGWTCEQQVNAASSISVEMKPMDDPKFRKAV